MNRVNTKTNLFDQNKWGRGFTVCTFLQQFATLDSAAIPKNPINWTTTTHGTPKVFSLLVLIFSSSVFSAKAQGHITYPIVSSSTRLSSERFFKRLGFLTTERCTQTLTTEKTFSFTNHPKKQLDLLEKVSSSRLSRNWATFLIREESMPTVVNKTFIVTYQRCVSWVSILRSWG